MPPLYERLLADARLPVPHPSEPVRADPMLYYQVIQAIEAALRDEFDPALLDSIGTYGELREWYEIRASHSA